MKQLKLFVLVLAAVLGLLAFAGAAVSQATVLCTTEDASECTMSYTEGTTVSLSSKSSISLHSTSGSLEATCTGSTVKGKTGPGTGGSIELSEWTWSGCNSTTTTVAAGSLEIEHIAGTHNGKVIGTGSEWTFVTAGVSCTFGFGTGTNIGTLTGGAEPVLQINTVVNKTAGSFLCAKDSILTAEYVVTEPHALFVT